MRRATTQTTQKAMTKTPLERTGHIYTYTTGFRAATRSISTSSWPASQTLFTRKRLVRAKVFARILSAMRAFNPLSTWGIFTRRAGKLYKARSRLSRSQILQINTRWKALAEIYTMNPFAPLWNRSLISKFSLKFAEICCFFSKNSQILPEFC